MSMPVAPAVALPAKPMLHRQHTPQPEGRETVLPVTVTPLSTIATVSQGQGAVPTDLNVEARKKH